MRFFFFQTNLVFKSKPAYIDILDSFCYSLCTFLFLIIDILRILMFIQCLYAFFIKTSKILIRFNIFFKVFNLKMFLLCLIFHETFLPVNCENISWR